MPQVTPFGYRAAAFIVAALLTACSLPNGIPQISAPISSDHSLTSGQTKSGVLYVANFATGRSGYDVSVYQEGGNFLRTTTKGIDQPVSLASDSSGNLYVGNNIGNSISVYKNRARRLVRQITRKLISPGAIAIDPQSNHLFVACNRYVVEYASGGSSPIRTLRTLSATALAIDAASNLYVASEAGVSVYPPASTKASYIITNGATGATSLAFDHTGNLYVAQFYSEQVSVYAPGATSPSYTLAAVNEPSAMTFDSSDNLYVANQGWSDVQEYAPGADEPTSTITQGLDEPNGLVFDSRQNLYVSNSEGNTIKMFDAVTHKLKRTITRSVANPIALLYVGS